MAWVFGIDESLEILRHGFELSLSLSWNLVASLLLCGFVAFFSMHRRRG